MESVTLLFDIRENGFLAVIWRRARAGGEEKDREEGRQSTRDILTGRFGPLDERTIRRIQAADQVALAGWTRRERPSQIAILRSSSVIQFVSGFYNTGPPRVMQQ